MKKVIIGLLLVLSISSVIAAENNIYKEKLKEKGYLYGCTPANRSLVEPIRGGLNWAVWHGELEIIDLEIKAGLDINQCSGVSVLAIEKNQPEALELLLKNKYNPDSKYIGQSALNYAIFYKKLDMVNILIKYGADVNYITQGNLPLNLAIMRKSPLIVKALLEAGAKPNEKTEKLLKKCKNEEIKALFQN